MPVQKFMVRGLTAENESAVETTLERLPGVFCASVSHRSACVEVDFDDDTVTTDAMSQALLEFGVELHIVG